MLKLTCRRIASEESEILDKIYRLRYHVYVQEREFLSARNFAEPKERDVYDPQSVHFAVLTEENDVLGTLRLILPCGRILPIEEQLGDLRMDSDRMDYAEVSRFIVSKSELNRYMQLNYEHPGAAVQDRLMSKMHWMSFQLCKAAVSYSVQAKISRWYAFMERSLWRLLVVHGIRFHAIGSAVSYFGQVIPFQADVRTFHDAIDEYLQLYPSHAPVQESFSNVNFSSKELVSLLP